ncbi:MAG: hypothetical protein AAB426_07150, partial [Myxococcota bacterium]
MRASALLSLWVATSAVAAEPGAAGISEAGFRGAQRVEAGRPLPAGTLLIGFGTDYAQTSGLFAEGDQNTQFHQRLWLTWTPLDLVSLG